MGMRKQDPRRRTVRWRSHSAERRARRALDISERANVLDIVLRRGVVPNLRLILNTLLDAQSTTHALAHDALELARQLQPLGSTVRLRAGRSRR